MYGIPSLIIAKNIVHVLNVFSCNHRFYVRFWAGQDYLIFVSTLEKKKLNKHNRKCI